MWGLIGAPQCAPSHILPQPQILFDLFPLALFHSSGRLRWSKWKKIYCSKHFFLTSREREVAGRRLPPRIFDFSLLFFSLKLYPTMYRFMKWFIRSHEAWKCEMRELASVRHNRPHKINVNSPDAHHKKELKIFNWLSIMIHLDDLDSVD